MEARDLLSKLEKSSDEKSEVDCSLKLGLEFYQAQPSSVSPERPRQANMPVPRDLHAVPAQVYPSSFSTTIQTHVHSIRVRKTILAGELK